MIRLPQPLTNQKLWDMSKVICEKLKVATTENIEKEVFWNVLEEDWFNWLEEELLEPSTNLTNIAKEILATNNQESLKWALDYLQKWLRDFHNILITIVLDQTSSPKWGIEVVKYNEIDKRFDQLILPELSYLTRTYEESLEIGIKNALSFYKV